MAGMKSIDEVRERLEESTLMLSELMEGVNELTNDLPRTPPMLWVINRLWEAVQKDQEAYMRAVHQYARPILDDMAKLVRSE